MKSSARGFTLVELLVSIAIIAVLSVIGLTLFSTAQQAARDAKRRQDLKAIAAALEQYKIINGSYPMTTGWILSTDGNSWTGILSSSYINSMPLDPTNSGGAPHSGGYTYAYYDTTGADFLLEALLESPNITDLRTKCDVFGGNGSTNSGATHIYEDTFWVCNQQ